MADRDNTPNGTKTSRIRDLATTADMGVDNVIQNAAELAANFGPRDMGKQYDMGKQFDMADDLGKQFDLVASWFQGQLAQALQLLEKGDARQVSEHLEKTKNRGETMAKRVAQIVEKAVRENGGQIAMGARSGKEIHFHFHV
jgi:hypothetical protein